MTDELHIAYLKEYKSGQQVVLNNTHNAGLIAIASAIIIFGGVKLIEEYTRRD